MFEDDLCQIMEVIGNMTMIKAVLESVVTNAFYQEFLGESGNFEWKRYEKVLTSAIKDKAAAKGHAAGLAEGQADALQFVT